MENAIQMYGPGNFAPMNQQAQSDEQLIHLWLHGRGKGTRTVYQADSEEFLNVVQKQLHGITLGDVQRFADDLEQRGLRPATRNRKLAVVKSLFSFAHRLGYLPFDIARPLRLVGQKDCLAERILDEGEVQRLLALEHCPRNHALLTLLYAAGLRVSELCAIKWSDLRERSDGGQPP